MESMSSPHGVGSVVEACNVRRWLPEWRASCLSDRGAADRKKRAPFAWGDRRAGLCGAGWLWPPALGVRGAVSGFTFCCARTRSFAAGASPMGSPSWRLDPDWLRVHFPSCLSSLPHRPLLPGRVGTRFVGVRRPPRPSLPGRRDGPHGRYLSVCGSVWERRPYDV